MNKKLKTIGTALTRQPLPIAVQDGLENAVAAMGGTRDKMSYNVWELNRVLGQKELENMYRSSWLAGKIISIPSDDMTREWRSVLVDNDDGTIKSKFEKAERKFKVKSKIHEALLWSRLYGGSVIIIGTRDGMRDPSNELVPESIRPGDLRYLHVLDRWRLSPSSVLTKDITSPNFGLPETYMIVDSAVQIHWSRILRFNGTKLPYFSWLQNAMWDDSILNRVMEALSNRETAVKAVATMMFEANVDVIQGTGMSDLLAMKGGEEKLVKRFQTAMMMKSFNRTLLLDASEKYEKKTNSFANLDGVLQEFMADVSGAADIPVTRLFGQSPSGLNATGESDVRNYYDKCSNDQESDVRPQLERLDEILYRSEIGDYPEDFTFEFNPLWQMSDKECADIRKLEADTDKIYIDSGVLHAGNVARELHDRGTYKTLTDADVELVEELAKPIDGDPTDPEVGLRSTKAAPPALAAGAIDPKTGLPVPPEDAQKPGQFAPAVKDSKRKSRKK